MRSLEGALVKIAHEVGKQFAPRKGRGPYFPLTDDPTKFPRLLEGELPNLAATSPHIAAAIERQQPYNPGYAVLGLLKALYRENHHHDFTLQERRQAQTQDFMIGGMILMSTGPHGITLGGPPEWRGVPIAQHRAPGSEVYIDGQLQPAGGEAALMATTFIDWYFGDPEVSVLGTLIPLHNLAAQACDEVWGSTGL